jgi:hypothetical protein
MGVATIIQLQQQLRISCGQQRDKRGVCDHHHFRLTDSAR